MRVERDESGTRLVQLDQMAEIGTGVAHHETLTVTGGRIESDRPRRAVTMGDGSFEGIDHERHMVHTDRRPDSPGLMFDDQFDHDVAPLSVGRRVVELAIESVDRASGEFDVLGHDEGSGARRRREGVDGGRRQIGHGIGDLTRLAEHRCHLSSLARETSRVRFGQV